MAPEPPSPSASSVLLPFLGARSRRGSLASISSRAVIDKDVLSQALDDIHTSASKSEALTSFHDYDGGNVRGGEAGRSASKGLVSNGVSGLYNRLRQSVSGANPTKDLKDLARNRDGKDNLETDSLRSSLSANRTKNSLSIKSPSSDNISIADTGAPFSSTASNSNNARNATSSMSTQQKPRMDARSRTSTQSGNPAPPFRPEAVPGVARGPHDAGVAHNPEGQDLLSTVNSDLERNKSVTQTLSKVATHHESSIKDQTRPNLTFDPDQKVEEALEDSDYPDEGEAIAVPSNRSMTNVSTKSVTSNVNDGSLPLTKEISRPPMVHVGVSHLPGFAPSRASSMTEGGDAASLSSAKSSAVRIALEPSPNLNSALQRRRTNLNPLPNALSHISVSGHLKRKILPKEFWMLDENARVCFSCGQSFSTFRRKHHCRTCGQIFDARCTSIVAGRPFGQPGTIRICKPCEEIIFDSDDDSSIISDDDEYALSPVGQLISHPGEVAQAVVNGRMHAYARPGTAVATPSIGIPVSRRNREAKRRSAVIEFDTQPPLARPTSSHSLVSLSRRPRSSSHRRRHSRYGNIRGLRSNLDERGPFYQQNGGDPEKKISLPVFHNDNVIDPDLAAFLSDDGSDDDEQQPNILAAIENANAASPGEREKLGFTGLFASALKKGRPKGSEKAPSTVRGVKEDDTQAHVTRSPKYSRSRNLSNASNSHNRPSPRRSRSALQFTPWAEGQLDNRPVSSLVVPQATISKAICSSAIQSGDKPRRELNPASHDHVRRLLSQLLRDAQIASAAAWEKALMPIILQCTDDVEPEVQQGDDMDIRQYIKLKKVPGGKPIDTSYVSGVVFSKNVALKTMARSIHQPRIVIVTFAIEYARHEAHFMSLEPVIAQEREYLQNLVGRIAALHPTVLLVQRHVSGLALHLLEKAGITVVCNIKQSVLAAVARVTQTMLIKSIDKLGIDPSHLGQCDGFEVKTFVSSGSRKTYIYLSGCEPDLGCTIVLRGADTKHLRNIKRITEFMCYVAYNLKLENYLMRDEFVYIPATAHGGLKAHDDGEDRPSSDVATLNQALKSARETTRVNADDLEGDAQFKYAHFEETVKNRVLSASPFVVFMQPYMLTQLRDLERRLASFKTLRDLYAAADEDGEDDEENERRQFELVQPDMVNVPPSKEQPKTVREYLHAVHEAQLEKATHSFETAERQWESFIDGEINPFDPFSHQKIVVLYSTISSITSAPCTGPELLGIEFYDGFNRTEGHRDEDLPLGQYIEDLCFGANSTCKDCHKKMYDHHRQYVHGYGQLSVSILRQNARMRGYNNTIFMWSTCRICQHETTVTPMSNHTWKYSFAKYLELSFWSSPLHPRAGACKHDIHKDFLRYFEFQDLVVRFQYDSIGIYDVVVPRSRVTWKVESDLNTKNEQFSRFVRRLAAFTESIKKRLESINVDTLDEKKSIEAYEYIQELGRRADDDHDEVLEKLQQKYAASRYYELIPLNRALRLMDEKAIAWDDIFSNFERDYFPSETDIRRLATLQLRNMFLESQPAPSSVVSEASDTEDMTELKPLRGKVAMNTAKPDEILSEKAHDVLSSVVEEQKGSGGDTNGSIDGSKTSPDQALDSGFISGLSPPVEQEQVIEREDVRHLDLAIPSKSPEDHLSSDSSARIGDSERVASPTADEQRQDPQTPFAIQPKPLSSRLLERIEKIRSNRADTGPDAQPAGSRIPRFTNLKKQEMSTVPTPPLLRTQSSPNRMPRLSLDLSSENGIDTVVNNGQIDTEGSPHEKRLGERLVVARLANKVGKLAPSLIPRSVPKAENKIMSSVSTLAKHFEEMSREFERERLRERRQRAMRSRQSRANPLASSRPVVEVYENANDAVGEREQEEAGDGKENRTEGIARQHMHETTAERQPTHTESRQQDQPQPRSFETEISDPLTETDAEGDISDTERSTSRSRPPSDPMSGSSSATLMSPTSAPDLTDLSPEINIPEHRKNVWFKYLAEFWSKRSASGWSNLEYPLHANEHVFEDSDIIVREDEPSSVIALSLACGDYKNKVKDFRGHPGRQASSKTSVSMSQGALDKSKDIEHQRDIEASLLSDTATHMKYSFSHGSVKASCKIFYAESFDALRRRCGVADRFIESMSRCLKFDSKGGKTKSLFLKTLDDRFIIKSLQEVELKAFTKFAPDYFNFMSYALFHGVPSVIAKMFGLFQVNIRNPATGVDFSYYLLVMENLFYERSPNRRFDLKGSMRNRKIESTGQADEVLLDENLVETIYESPLFVREQSCRLLQASVFNDTLWLCKQNVMDYSLMAGFDDSRKELVVGIIDCIRTYTWDKKLESWIKDRGKNKPTITSPKDYRNRFRVSMTQYVLQAPSCWHRFQAQMAGPKKLKEAEKDELDDVEAEKI